MRHCRDYVERLALRVTRAIVASASLIVPLAGCQFHLPPLETSPQYPGPNIQDAINHVQCELATIVNAQSITAGNRHTLANRTLSDRGDPTYDRLKERVDASARQFSETGTDHQTLDDDLATLLPRLYQDHFVATVQLTLEVTDSQGLNPSANFINVPGTLVGSVGGQLTGTQDRSVTVNYVIDLEKLRQQAAAGGPAPTFCKNPQISDLTKLDEGLGLSGGISGDAGGIAGDLGLADIVADGLIALNQSAKSNIYGTTGPAPLVAPGTLSIQGTISDKSYGSVELSGNLAFSPQSANVGTPGTVTLIGTAIFGSKVEYPVNWTGTILTPAPGASSHQTISFTLGGSLSPPFDPKTGANVTAADLGANPSVSLIGTIDSGYHLNTITLNGVLTQSAELSKTVYGLQFPTKAAVAVQSEPLNKELLASFSAAAGKGPSASSGGASSGSGSSTSFGSLVDFTLVYGINGGPTWSFKHFKGPAAGSTPLVSLTRTNLDSLSVTFVAACRDPDPANPISQAQTYWDALPLCDAAPDSRLQSAAYGAGQNYLMRLQNAFTRGPALGQ